MLTYAIEYPEFKDTLMKMLYLFLLSKAKPIQPKKLEPLENQSSPEVIKKQKDALASPPDQLPNLETSSNSKCDSNPQIDLAKMKAEYEPANTLDFDKHPMLNSILEMPEEPLGTITRHR